MAPRARNVVKPSGEPTVLKDVDRTRPAEAPSSSSVLPVAKTATRRLGRPPGPQAPHQGYPGNTPSVQNTVLLRRAEGASYNQISRELDLGPQTIRNILKKPEVQERIQALRDQWKEAVNAKLGDLAPKTMAMLEKTVEQRDTQAFMRTSIGLANLERVSNSASGEKQKVEVSGVSGESVPRVEIKNLLVALFGPAEYGEPKPLSGN